MIDFTQKIDLASLDTENLRAIIGAPNQTPITYYDAASARTSGLNGESLSTITQPAEITEMLSHWFFNGLLRVSFKFKPDRVEGSERQFTALVARILQSRQPSHNHKMAFLTQLIHECCVSTTYQKC